ncbi:MAG: hypothetical protein HOP17_05660 [Acidobacteria bacterium]|nr:hypothetical protein [Acidobacteriota bacterium]
MHCPKCGQQQISDEIRYCSCCGFLLTGIAEIVANDGILPARTVSKGTKSKRTQGLKQAAFIMILGIVLVPIWIAFLAATNGPPELAVAAVFFFLGSAILRGAYAFLFQSNEPLEFASSQPQPVFHGASEPNALPRQTSVPADAYAAPGTGAWRDTNDLGVRGSVTDTTTKLLSKRESR